MLDLFWTANRGSAQKFWADSSCVGVQSQVNIEAVADGCFYALDKDIDLINSTIHISNANDPGE